MSHTDPIADMISRIKNAINADKHDVSIPLSTVKVAIAKILKREGYIEDYRIEEEFPAKMVVTLKYVQTNKKNYVIGDIKRMSKPGQRIFVGVDEIPKVLGGLGVALLSTSKGLMTGKDCLQKNIGGELMLQVW
jgi:small subunit ribosomal protein S8